MDRPRENAICLYTTDFSETSQVVHFFARETGVIHLLAKGSKRPKSATGGRIDLLSEGELVFIPPRGEALGTLVEFAEAANHSPLRRRLPALNAAMYMLEITGLLLAQGDPHPQVFDLLSAALRRLDDADAPVQAVLAYFQWRLLQHVGLLGDMQQCVSCAQPVAHAPAYFTSKEGGLLCRNCEAAWAEKHALNASALAAIAALRAATGERRAKPSLSEREAGEVNDLLAYHISYQLGKPIRMLRYVRP